MYWVTVSCLDLFYGVYSVCEGPAQDISMNVDYTKCSLSKHSYGTFQGKLTIGLTYLCTLCSSG